MDDFVFWCDSRAAAAAGIEAAAPFLSDRLALRAKRPVQLNRSRCGVTICGFRVLPGVVRLSQRRRRRYLDAVRRSEGRFAREEATGLELQRDYDAAHAITE